MVHSSDGCPDQMPTATLRPDGGSVQVSTSRPVTGLTPKRETRRPGLSLLLEESRGQMGSIGPFHRPGFGVHPHLGEELRISEWLEDLTDEFLG